MAKTDVATTGGTNVAPFDYGDMKGQGLDDVSAREKIIPFIKVLAQLSPECNKGPKQVKGAAPGMLINSASNTLFEADIDEEAPGILFQPVVRQCFWNEWIHTDDGGGLVAQHPVDSEFVRQKIAQHGDRKIEFRGDDGKTHQLIETYYLYGHLLEDDGVTIQRPVVLSFSITKMKPYRQFIDSMLEIKGKPPLCAFRARIQTIGEVNKKGQPYFNFKISPGVGDAWKDSLLDPSKEAERNLLVAGTELLKQVQTGAARMADESGEESHAQTADDIL